ncbi:MAG: TonB-dependent receptor [Bdellovibrionaceae bacterium]|nr:TonB-dependent receptor [Pseudobdellovibrionaceae bacterium]
MDTKIAQTFFNSSKKIWQSGACLHLAVCVFLNAPLARSVPEETITVLAPKVKGSFAELLNQKKASLQVNEVLSSESMSKTGDSDSAQSLKRVTGLTLMNGKYIYVRGLGERYSSVLYNSQSVPSPEPSRRIVPLDLFPVALLENIQVKKSYSTDLPAEFGGGLISLTSKTAPSRNQGNFKLGLQLNSETDLLFPQSAPGDFWGKDASYRTMPSLVKEKINNRQRVIEKIEGLSQEGFTRNELQSMGKEFKSNYNLHNRSSTPLPNMSTNWGTVTKWDDIKLSHLGSLNYSNSVDSRAIDGKKLNAINDSQLALDETSRSETFENQIKSSLQMDFEGSHTNSKIRFNILNLNDTSHEVSVKTYSVMGDSVTSRRRTQIEWIERTLDRKQLSGLHRLDGPQDTSIDDNNATGLFIDWKLQDSTARRYSPDAKEYTYLQRMTQYEFNTDTTGNRRNYSYLDDKTQEANVDVWYKWDMAKVKIGYLQNQRRRNSDVYRFHFKDTDVNNKNYDLGQDFDSIFNQFKNSDTFQFLSVTDSADSYYGQQHIASQYVWTEWQLGPKWEIGAGVRAERNQMEVGTFYYYSPDDIASLSGIRTYNQLPAFNVNYNFSENLKIRTSISQTLARPDFRELSTAPYIDEDSGYETVGNPVLKTTLIQNFDHRYEYFWKEDEYLSIGFFRKEFSNPIESQFEPSPNLRKTFGNSKSAYSQGIELENRFNLRYLSRDLRRFYFSYNLSSIDSGVDLSNDTLGLQTSKERPLQGQSPYIVNWQLGYDNPNVKWNCNLIFNMIGRRITEVGTQNRPDIYEEPQPQFDITSNYRVSKDSLVSFRGRNILNPEVRFTQGGEIVRQEKKGDAYSVSWSYNFL